METTQMFIRESEARNIQYHDSERLTNIDGFLMIYGRQCHVTISTRLSPEEKAHGIEFLLRLLAEIPVGKSGVYLWSIDDEFQLCADWLSIVANSPYHNSRD